EIRVCLDVLADHRLLTLTGPGGTGKTRMALEIARRCEADFGDGAFFVGLASLSDPALVPMAILEVLGLKTASGVDPWEHLVRHLADRSTLLILDNFEQLLDGAAVISNLLAECASLRVVVTSRSALRLLGEREFPVPPLEVPRTADPGEVQSSDAIRLFESRAKAVRPDFSLHEANLDVVREIVTSLDGLPLAIELAASRLRSITPDLLLERLDNRLLASRSADLPERQQTIVNTIGWSYDLLDERSKLLFEQLSVFSGTFGLTEAEQVCGPEADVLDGLTGLVENSLLRQMAVAGEPRFRMLTVIREFAYAALVSRGADRPILDRHARVYMALAERADDEILTSSQLMWLSRLGDEHDNLRAAFDHSVSVGDADTALRLAGSLWRFWHITGHLREGLQRTEVALGMGQESSPVARAHALTCQGGLLYWQGDWQATLAPYEEALSLFRQHGSDAEVAEALYNACFPLVYLGQSDKATELLEESLALNERIGREIGVGRALWGLGNVANQNHDWAEAVANIERSVEIFSKLDAPFDLGWAWFMLAHSRYNMGETEQAIEPLGHALDVFAEVNDVSALSLILDLVAAVTQQVGAESTAAYFVGASQRLKIDTGIEIGEVEMNRYTELQALDRRLRTEPTTEYEEGANASLPEVIERTRTELIRLLPSS
ncbi:MAG TPA: tetratricopeptide repeat protein, partial [Acidimicrobiia bacterium]